jgi:outer membrane protein assembly factor BamB
MNWRLISATAIVAAVAHLNARGNDWPQWRGPDRNGISKESGWSDTWPQDGPPILWKVNVGLGFTSIVVSKGRAVTVGHADADKDTVFCFDAVSGKELWKNSYAAELGDKYFEGGTTGTATFDGDHVYWLSRWGDLFCFDAASGKIVWNRQIEKEEHVKVPTWGFAGATTVLGDMLILNAGENGMAVDKKSGKTIWQSANKEAGYSTPLPVQRGGKTEVWLANTTAYVGIDPSNGKELWRMKWLTQYGVNGADPIPVADDVFVSTGYGKGCALFKPNGENEPTVIWKSKVLRTQLNPAVLVGKYIYGVDGDTTDKAALKCIEAETGTEKWAFPNFGSGAVIVADNKFIALNGTGELMVAPVSHEAFKPTSRAQVLGGKTWTAPVLANGLVYCRNSRGDIVALDLRKK